MTREAGVTVKLGSEAVPLTTRVSSWSSTWSSMFLRSISAVAVDCPASIRSSEYRMPP